MLKYQAKLLQLDEDIEEWGRFLINGIELVCFIDYVQCKLEIGKSYSVELDYQIFDEYLIDLVEENANMGFIHINDTFQYDLFGVFRGNIFSVQSIDFIDDYLLSNFTYLENKIIHLSVNRLDIAIYQ